MARTRLRTSAGKAKVGQVLHEYKLGRLRSGSKRGPRVTNRRQAIAIGLSEGRRLEGRRR
jgi:hypothetical protein